MNSNSLFGPPKFPIRSQFFRGVWAAPHFDGIFHGKFFLPAESSVELNPAVPIPSPSAPVRLR